MKLRLFRWEIELRRETTEERRERVRKERFDAVARLVKRMGKGGEKP